MVVGPKVVNLAFWFMLAEGPFVRVLYFKLLVAIRLCISLK